MTLSLSKRPIAIFVVLFVVGIASLLYFQKPAEKNVVAETRSVAVRRADIEELVTAQGKLEPKEYVDVGVQVSGQLKKLYVAIGDTVKKGQLIAEIDPALYQSKVASDEAQLKSLHAQLAEQQAQAQFARQSMERNKRLIKAKAVSQEALEDSQTSLKVAQAKVESIAAQMEQATSSLDGNKTNLSYTKIYSPIDGTVVTQPVNEGQTLNSNQSAPTVMQIANLDIMTVRTQVAEADVMRLTPDMEVYFTTLGAPDHKWRGKIRQILPSPETINDVVLYNALVDVENTGRQLMTGMSTQVFFVADQAKQVLVVPVRALGKPTAMPEGQTGTFYTLRVEKDGNAEDRSVEVGLITRTLAEIKSGINEDEKVLTPEITEKPGGGNNRQGGRMPGGIGRTPTL